VKRAVALVCGLVALLALAWLTRYPERAAGQGLTLTPFAYLPILAGVPIDTPTPTATATATTTDTPTPTPTSAPTTTPTPYPPGIDWVLASPGIAAPNCGVVHFNGQVQAADGSPLNWVCVYLGHYGPRTIKPSGGGGAGDGNWGFAPCGPAACTGPFDIYVVDCPPNVPRSGLTLDPNGTPPPPANSEQFHVTVTDPCKLGQWEGITFRSTH
jgi:hypothetical protein